jgi:hypothetical protein
VAFPNPFSSNGAQAQTSPYDHIAGGNERAHDYTADIQGIDVGKLRNNVFQHSHKMSEQQKAGEFIYQNYFQ